MGNYPSPMRARTRALMPDRGPSVLEVSSPSPRLLPRQAAFLDLYFRGMPGAQAYRQAYNPAASQAVASAAASRLLAKGSIRDFLDRYRVETFLLVRKTYIDAITTAMEPVYGRGKGGRREVVAWRPDWKARTEAAEALAELHALYPKNVRKG